ncbi:MAG: oligosaccharide flippase family protein [Candidatus Amulumruptor caecigallinarius]|nr:oligosaccharide flippase family protein [Candidatus Amulumruptor caecigallinarius]
METIDKMRENNFRSILKGTSMFGGVQVFNILISAVRLKFVAAILGPSGIGVAGLFNSVSLTIRQFTSLGLNMAVVKEVGAAKESEEQLHTLLSALRPLILILALTGALICLFIPGTLSRLTFGSERYSTSFMLLSAAIFFSIVGEAVMSVLQGMHEVKRLSKASLTGSAVGLFTGVPLYWFWGTDGIVPAMVLLSICTCAWYCISLRKTLSAHPAPWHREIHMPVIRRILAMGLVLMSNDLVKSLVSYLINIYIRNHGGVEEVGFYQSCNTMTAQYSAILFTAMAMDYLPRLSATAKDNVRMCEVVNRQIEVACLLVMPIVCCVIFLAPLVIELLQTKEFLTATPLLRMFAFATMIQAIMYPLGYIVFAKSNRKLFFWMESIGANLLTLILSICGYRLFGLYGLGVALIADCGICLTTYIIVNRRLYDYHINRHVIAISALTLASGIAMSLICFLMQGVAMTLCASALVITSSAISARRLLKLWKN